MKFYVLPYTFARQFVPTEPTLAIRIFDPGCQDQEGNNLKQKLVESPLWVAELHYTFADYDPLRYTGFAAEVQEGIRKEYENMLLTPLVAERMLCAFAAHKDKVSTVMVHCNAGLSRSPAVALALCERFKLAPEWIGARDYYMKNCQTSMAEGKPAPNTIVYDTLMEAGLTANI